MTQDLFYKIYYILDENNGQWHDRRGNKWYTAFNRHLPFMEVTGEYINYCRFVGRNWVMTWSYNQGSRIRLVGDREQFECDIMEAIMRLPNDA